MSQEKQIRSHWATKRNIFLFFYFFIVIFLRAGDWTQISPSTNPSSRSHHDMAYIGDDKILLYGGYNNLDDTWIYDISDNAWTQKSPSSVPNARFRHALAYIGDDQVMLYGGQYAGTYYSEIWIYDLSDDNWTQKSPSVGGSGLNASQDHDISYIGNDQVLLHGGNPGISGTWLYDLSNNQMTNKNPSGSGPGTRYYHQMCYLGDDQVLFFGGADANGYYKDTYVYDLSANTWTLKNPSESGGSLDATGYKLHGLAYIGGDQAVLFGGKNNSSNFIDTFLYDLSANTWTKQSTGSNPGAGESVLSASSMDGSSNVLYFHGTSTWEYDFIVPTVTASTISSDNSTIDVTFSEAVYNTNSGSGALETSDFTLSISGGTATLSSTTPSSISASGNVYTLGISLSGTPDGSETVTVVPSSSTAIYDAVGNVASTTQSNNTDYLQAQSVTISGNDGFRMMSSPVSGTIFSDLLAELWIQGMTGGDTESGSANVWTFDVANQTWTALTNLSTASLTAGEGFLVYVFSDTDADGDNDLPVTLSVSGSENTSSASVSSITNGNWALVGNPYASTIDWDLVSQTNVATSAYVWDDATSAYISWNGSAGSLTNGLIAPYQGFWVQASGGTGSVTVETADKSSTAGTFYKTMNDSTGSMSFSITSGEYNNQTFVSFMNNGEAGMDNSDAYKLLPMSPSECVVGISYAEGNALDINNLPFTYEGSISIPLDIMYLTLDEDYNFVTQEEAITMNWDLSSLPETIIGLTLTNNINGETTNLLQTDELTFSTQAKGSFPAYGSNGVNIYPEVGESQFTLTVAYSALSSGEESPFPTEFALHQSYPNPFNPSTMISFVVPIDAKHITQLQVFNINGQLVETLVNEELEPGRHKIKWNPVNISSGVYIVQLKAGEKVFNQKVTYIK